MRPSVQTRRPYACVEPRPARLLSTRAVLVVWATYAVLFGLAALHAWGPGG